MARKKGDSDTVAGCILVLVLLALVFIFSPGMLLMAVAQSQFDLGFDRGQMWTFAVLVSVAVFVAILLVCRRRGAENVAAASLLSYSVLSLLIIASLLICQHGFKAKFPERFAAYFIGDEQPNTALQTDRPSADR